jgi:type I restriction enzyme S subunit
MAASALAERKPIHVPAAYGQARDGWTWARLDDISEGVFDCPHSTPKLTDEGPLVVRTQDVMTGIFRADQAGHVSEETYAERIARVTPSHGDLLYSREGTYFGIAAEVPANTRVCLGQRMVLIRPDKRRLDFRFLRHWLNSPIMAAHIHGYRDGTVAERLNLPTIRALPILVPPLPGQKAIAAVLGALDDKIELNRRMNATLEAMARALFQSWFVDFDPVRAKAVGRPPAGLDEPTAALFPAQFQAAELGEIPQGWKAATLGRIIIAVRERILDADAIVLSAVSSSELVRSDEHFNKKVYSKSISNYLKVRRWDFAYNPSRINIGSVGLLKEDVIGAASPVYEVFRPNTGFHWFVERFLAYPDTKNWIQTLCSGSVRQSLKLKDLASIPCVIPPPEIIAAFNREWERLLSLILANNRQTHILVTLRDTLLPKLLSGQVRPLDESNALEAAV